MKHRTTARTIILGIVLLGCSPVQGWSITKPHDSTPVPSSTPEAIPTPATREECLERVRDIYYSARPNAGTTREAAELRAWRKMQAEFCRYQYPS